LLLLLARFLGERLVALLAVFDFVERFVVDFLAFFEIAISVAPQ
jgi:hypothetical protein